MSWSTLPRFPRGSGTWGNIPTFPRPAMAWQPYGIRLSVGLELLTSEDYGTMSVSSLLTGSDLSEAIDSGLLVAPGLTGQELHELADAGILTAMLFGSELAESRDYGAAAIGGTITERYESGDVGLIVPGAFMVPDALRSTDGALAMGIDGSGLDSLGTDENGPLAAALNGLEDLTSADTGEIIFHAILAELSEAEDSGLVLAPVLQGLESGVADDVSVSVNVAGAGLELSVSTDAGAGAFPQLAAVLQVVTATSNVAIPYWPRYVDRVVLGAGGGGNGGPSSATDNGRGGNSGDWNSHRHDRGEGRDTVTVIQFTIGNGGTGGAKGGMFNNPAPKAGNPGGATSATIPGVGTLTGNGGTGGSGTTSGSGRNGSAAGDHSFQGSTYTGGGTTTGDTASVPGSGGYGGPGQPFPLTPGNGRQGARGQGWAQFSS